MVRYKYTPEALGEAATAAHSVTDVMRLLGVRISGGSHAHISRQLKRFGVDTSHFTGGAHNKGRRGERRTTSSQLLVRLPEGARRTPGSRLKWALRDIGVPEECEECAIGPTWRGRSLILHVDHINGDFLDNRPPNLRLLCPNCHSQTATYAGRNRGPATPPTDVPSTPPRPLAPLAPEVVADLIRQVEAGILRPVDAARSIGCHRNHLPRLRQRLATTGTVTPAPRQASGPAPGSTHHETVVRYALANPTLGPRKLAGVIQESSGGECVVSHGTVSNILRRAGLHTVSARRSRLSGSAGVA